MRSSAVLPMIALIMMISAERATAQAVPPDEQLRRARAQLLHDGLTPAHYELPPLEAVTAMILDLRFGRARAAAHRSDPRVAGDARRLLDSPDLAREIRAVRPKHFMYAGLAAALRELRAVERAGGWPRVAPGPPMRRDSADARVPLLRRRLGLGDATVFDDSLDRAVRAFQHRHGLNEDGVVGPATLAELNVPVETRIDQVRINLERARWVTPTLPATFIAVNIAGAKVYMMRDGAIVFEERAIVGKTYTRTPVFNAELRYIDLNPTWTVPKGIIGEVSRAAARDPTYLRRENITFSNGTYVQAPGPLNALGRIKLVFPNRYNVYLHDTPARSLFEREQRLFSHGCIRLRNPVQLATLALNDPQWSRQALERAIATGRTTRIMLKQPLQVQVLYWTASTDLHGELHFYRDVYQRDGAVLQALDRPRL